MHRAKTQKDRNHIQTDKAKKRGMVEYFAKRYKNDPKTVAARWQMEHKAYGK